jgi:hypothetical protein
MGVLGKRRRVLFALLVVAALPCPPLLGANMGTYRRLDRPGLSDPAAPTEVKRPLASGKLPDREKLPALAWLPGKRLGFSAPPPRITLPGKISGEGIDGRGRSGDEAAGAG